MNYRLIGNHRWKEPLLPLSPFGQNLETFRDLLLAETCARHTVRGTDVIGRDVHLDDAARKRVRCADFRRSLLFEPQQGVSLGCAEAAFLVSCHKSHEQPIWMWRPLSLLRVVASSGNDGSH